MLARPRCSWGDTGGILFNMFFFYPHPRICLLILEKEEEERERNIDAREEHHPVASHACPDQGWNCNLGMCPD